MRNPATVPGIEDQPMSTDDHDLLIEIRTMLQTALARITGHDQRLDGMDQRLRSAEADIRVLQAAGASGSDVAVLKAGDARDREDGKHRQNLMWKVIGVLASICLLAATIADIVK